ncbi:MAG: hypothetical protein KIT44_09395 [Opitutaceae bacterium]|nr:hypothetical protein [Opitutaceae bacterium]
MTKPANAPKRKQPAILRRLARLDEVPPAGTTFRFRADSFHDVTDLLIELPAGEMTHLIRVETAPRQDCFCQITLKTLSLDQLRDLMRRVLDGQVMLQTVQPWQSYTGKRDYNLT